MLQTKQGLENELTTLRANQSDPKLLKDHQALQNTLQRLSSQLVKAKEENQRLSQKLKLQSVEVEQLQVIRDENSEQALTIQTFK